MFSGIYPFLSQGFTSDDGVVQMLISIPDFLELVDAGAFAVIGNAAMHINDALKEEGNGEVSAVLRERLKKWEVANTWIRETAWGFSISYRKSQTIPGSAGYVIPAGAVCSIQFISM